MDKMLINATQADELRVALVRDKFLFDLDIERSGAQKKKANIYKGRITRIEPSLAAAFIEYGAQRQGFLPLKEVAPIYWKSIPAEDEKVNIADVLKEGQDLMVQVEKVERGNKGAALTTYITLAGCYLVMMPNSPKAGGISRRIDGGERDDLKSILNSLDMPENIGVIIRTAGVGKSLEDLQWDLDVLKNQWEAIEKAYGERPAPFLIHQEGDVVIRSIRDNLKKEVEEIIVDNAEIYVKVKNYIEQVRPDFISKLKLYQDTIPLFNRFQIESQIETAHQREVILPSGGSIVIDRTEALVSIDINSGKATSGGDIEETALNTNLEAASEIARQLRLRDLGGLIVIDFIDMNALRNQKAVENHLKEALNPDRARIQVGRISRFGLLEMSRQRLRPSLSEHSQILCPKCDGRGSVRSIGSLALSMIRIIEEEAIREDSNRVEAQLPIEIATVLLNEKRSFINEIEKRLQVEITIIPNKYLDIPNYKVQYFGSDDKGYHSKPSYRIPVAPEIELSHRKKTTVQNQDGEPAIKQILPTQKRQPKKKKIGIIRRILSNIFGGKSKKTPQTHSRNSSNRNNNYRARAPQQNRYNNRNNKRRSSN